LQTGQDGSRKEEGTQDGKAWTHHRLRNAAAP
jgi:hypothetical protein